MQTESTEREEKQFTHKQNGVRSSGHKPSYVPTHNKINLDAQMQYSTAYNTINQEMTYRL